VRQISSIAVRLSLTIVLAVLLTTIAVTWLVLREERHTLESELKQKGLYIAEIIAQQMIEPLLYEERHVIYSILQTLKSTEKGVVISAAVYDTNGIPIISSHESSTLNNSTLQMVYQSEGPIVMEDMGAQLYTIWMPIKDRSLGSIGYLQLKVTKQLLNETIGNVKRKVYLFSSVIVVVGIMLGLFMSRRILLPILFLSQGVKRVAEGDLGVEIDVKGVGEIRDLSMAFNEMSKKIKDSVESIKAAQDNLIRKEKLYALGEFSASIAHEIKNPLTSIKMLIQSAKESGIRLEGRDIDIIEGEINRIDRIVKEFLAFARPVKATSTDIDLNLILNEVIALIRRDLQQRRITLIERLDPTIGKIKSHPDGLKQIFLNIMLNSIQAMQEGGILTVSSYSNNGTVYAGIMDTGHGIPEDIRHRIFDPFFTTKDDGTGMGLSIAYKIVKDHGGNIEVESIVNKGTIVYVSFPILRETDIE